MPAKAFKPCSAPGGCPNLVTDTRYCPDHEEKYGRTDDQQRGSAAKRGYGRKWAAARLAFLQKHPVCECEECKASGRPQLAEVVDHITPHQGDQKLFWDRKNWRAMSKPHHDRDTATYDGGFGNRRKEKR